MDSSTEKHMGHPLTLIGSFAALSLLYAIGKVLHTLYVNPLSKIPGPKINALSRVPYVRHLLKGTTVDNVVALHDEFGPVVRLSPNEVSFTSVETAFPDIYGFRTGKLKGHENMQKDPAWYAAPINGAKSILLADDEAHSRGRKILSHAFSMHALSEQQGLVQQYVDQLVNRLKETSRASSAPQDMTKWYNWITFDVIADLLFGEPFGCLQDGATHQYITLLFGAVKATRFAYVMIYFPWFKYLGSMVVDKNFSAKREEYMAWIHSRVQKRVETERDRPDFMTRILEHNGEKSTALTPAEIDSNANLILTAGSETTATLLSGATYALLMNPQKLEKLKQKVRGRWKSYDEITLAEVNTAPYLLAVLNEALRYFPPIPAGFQRRVGKGGEVVSGYYLPEGTAVAVSHFPAYRSEANFHQADKFIPERWLDDAPVEFANDKKSFCQPFSFGPRNCLGKNLAYAEMRLIVAKMIWSFDLELEEESRDWVSRCKVKTLWDKPELMVRIKEVVR